MTAAFVLPDFESEEWKESSRCYHEIRHGRMCQQCEKPFGPDDPVYRALIHRKGKISPSINTVCKDCAPPEGTWHCGRWTHCEACQRKFRQIRPHTGYYDYCCEVCQHRVYSRNQRKRPKPVDCEVCGETFVPPRSDAKTCSSACRQKAYRRRRALQINHSAPAAWADTRNASPDKPVTDGPLARAYQPDAGAEVQLELEDAIAAVRRADVGGGQ